MISIMQSFFLRSLWTILCGCFKNESSFTFMSLSRSTRNLAVMNILLFLVLQKNLLKKHQASKHSVDHWKRNLLKKYCNSGNLENYFIESLKVIRIVILRRRKEDYDKHSFFYRGKYFGHRFAVMILLTDFQTTIS